MENWYNFINYFSAIMVISSVFYLSYNHPSDNVGFPLYTNSECLELFENSTINMKIKTEIIDISKPYLTVYRAANYYDADIFVIHDEIFKNNKEIKNAFEIADILYDGYLQVPHDCQNIIIEEIDYTTNVSYNELINLMRVDPSVSKLYLDDSEKLNAPTSPSFYVRTSDKFYGVGIFFN
jgi:hypothetical protein